MVSFIWNKQKYLNENEKYTKVCKTAFMFVTSIVSYDGAHSMKLLYYLLAAIQIETIQSYIFT